MSRKPRQKPRYRGGALVAVGATMLAAAIAALGPSGDFPRIFLYVACTLVVCACTTVATIRALAWLLKGSAGAVEFGALIGLFVVAPATLAGAFELLQAVVGTP